MSVFFRIFQHLLPDGLATRIRDGQKAWAYGHGHKWGEQGLKWGSTAGGRPIDRFFRALTSPFARAREFVDGIYLDLFSETTRELDRWEHQFGLIRAAAESDRRSNISAAWQATGGQSPRYLQDIMQAAGFDIYIHQWWTTGAPYDPRDHTTDPLFGTVQCGEPLAQCGETTAFCNNFLANEPGYLVNRNLLNVAPPAIPSDPDKWRYFLYWGAATFPNKAQIPAARRLEFERLLLKLCPTRQWLVTLVDYV